MWTTRYCPRIFCKALLLIFQITLESKKDVYGNCYIDFYLIEKGNIVANEKSEIRECKTHGLKNRLDFGPGWGDWQGWVRLDASLPAKLTRFFPLASVRN